MSATQKLRQEIQSLALTTLFFWCWIAALVTLKKLLLAEYHIQFAGLSRALVGALILAKVVLVLEHVSLGPWFRARAAWVNVAARTALYAAGVVVVLVLERGLEGWKEHGGFGPALRAAFQGAEIHHVAVNMICVTGALLFHNVLAVVRRQLGERSFLGLFLSPIRVGPESGEPVTLKKGH